jgi:hypothetical protein
MEPDREVAPEERHDEADESRTILEEDDEGGWILALANRSKDVGVRFRAFEGVERDPPRRSIKQDRQTKNDVVHDRVRDGVWA